MMTKKLSVKAVPRRRTLLRTPEGGYQPTTLHDHALQAVWKCESVKVWKCERVKVWKSESVKDWVKQRAAIRKQHYMHHVLQITNNCTVKQIFG